LERSGGRRIQCQGGEKEENEMKACTRCGTLWTGYGGEPRAREVCEGCGAYLHTCVNCHRFDRHHTNSCTLPDTAFVGSRDSLNYCEEFRMLDRTRRANENRVVRAKAVWEELFKP
jgi:hypothetical protein